LKIIICDDNTKDRQSVHSFVKKYLAELNAGAEILVYENGEKLTCDLSFLKTDEPLIAFLDIYMPGQNGIDVARKIRDVNKNIKIIFTTNSLDHGLEGYSVKALQYLVKPVKYSEIKDTLDDCIGAFAEALRYIEVTLNKVVTKIALKDIYYIEVTAHDCLIHTKTGVTKSRCTLDEMEQQLGGSTLLRTHRSYIVNMYYIKSIAENDFLLTDGIKIPIRKNGKLQIKQAYMDFLFKEARGI